MSKKLALIIGNSDYKDTNLSQLVTPPTDVNDLAGVLRDPKIGSFDQVTTLFNQPCATIQRAIAQFFAGKKREDLLLLYFSGHGVLDDRGRLYMAVQNTECDLLSATAIEAIFITDEMDRSRSRRQVLILDCCHSGAFARGTKGAPGASVGTGSAFEGTGYGRVVLTATDSTQYAWEGDQVLGEAENSLFTYYLIQGIQTGKADADADGRITLDELYEYVYEQVVTETPRQTPGKWAYKQQGDIVIARNPNPVVKPAELPSELLQAIKDPRLYVRKGGLEELGKLLFDSNKGLAIAAQEALKRLKDDDSLQVSTLAADTLARYDEVQCAGEEYVAEVERLVPERIETKRPKSEKAGVDKKVAGKGEMAAKQLVRPAWIPKKIWWPTMLTSIGWAIGMAIGSNIACEAEFYFIGLAIIGSIGGLITGLALRQAEPSITRKQINIISMGWAILGIFSGLYIGELIRSNSWSEELLHIYIIEGAVFGAIGGLLMFWQFNRIKRRA